MALFIINSHHYFLQFLVHSTGGWSLKSLCLASNKSLLCSRLWVMCSVMCPHISWPGPGLSQQKYHSCQNSRKENTFLADMPGDTWWWANGTEMSNISTVPDYKYLTKISQNFLNILEWKLTPQSANQWRRAVRLSRAELRAEVCQPVWRSRITWIASVQS